MRHPIRPPDKSARIPAACGDGHVTSAANFERVVSAAWGRAPHAAAGESVAAGISLKPLPPFYGRPLTSNEYANKSSAQRQRALDRLVLRRVRRFTESLSQPLHFGAELRPIALPQRLQRTIIVARRTL
jgi:hypothetical protein